MSNTTILSRREASFKFINEFDSSDKSFYIIDIKVDELLYVSGKIFYDISYDCKFRGEQTSKNKIHPFYNGKDIEDDEGVILIKNKMTEIMVEYLLKTSEDLEKEIGLSTVQGYKTCIMLGLAKLWD
jgi:hypothetical protein